jgi:phage shock protein A
MNIQKAQWTNSENRINLSFPISKVNKEKRTVSGFATLDNVDRHGDIVTSDASEKAFQRFRGNLRQMHQPIAIGKVLSFHPEDFLDKETNKTYKGIYVDAYISKGAQDAWEKILDGTYTGFSIGGNIVTASYEPGDDNKDHRVIKEYDLMELSVVDSPANQLSNIFSIQKNADGTSVIKGMAADTQIENVYWCKQDNIASSTVEKTKDCVVCGTQMENVGWIESAETEKGLAISKVIDQYLKKDDAPGPTHAATTQDGDAGTVVDSHTTINLHPDQNPKKKSESEKDSASLQKGGIKMADETTEVTAIDAVTETTIEKSEQPEDLTKVEEVAPAETAPAEEAVEKSVTSADSTESFAKMLTDMRDLFSEALEKNSAESNATITKSVETVEAARAEMHKALEDLAGKQTELTNNIADFFKRLEALEKRIGAYEQDTAVQKSVGDVDSVPRDSSKLQKGFSWDGSFLGVQNF